MGIEFLRPYMLLLIPFAVFFILYTSKRLGKMPKVKKRFIVIMRNIILILIVFSLAGTNLTWKAKDTTTIFLIDASESMLSYRSEVEGFVREAIKNKGSKDKIGVIAFGENALVENFISEKALFNKIETIPNGNYTNIENAVTTALSIFPSNSKKRIVLLTDGEENEGNSRKIAPSILDADIDFKIYKIDKEVTEEAAIDNIEVPKRLSKGQEFNVVVNITSTTDTSAKLSVYSGNTKTSEENVKLIKGKNRFVFKDTASVSGFKSYKVILEPKIDTEIKNNESSAFTNIEDRPKILLVEDNPEEGEEMAKVLKSADIDFNRTSSKAVPRNIEGLTQYKSIMFCNVSAENLNIGFLNALESYVKDFGGGFIAAGGEESFALGGYFETSLEKVLPVYMDMRGKKEIPDMAMVLVIDKSGSMTEGAGGYPKIELAKEAAIRALNSLRQKKDSIGVIAFDGTVYWAVKTQKIEDKGKIEETIGTIRSGGGTSILPALESAYSSLKDTNAKIKHIILLTDGQAERYGYDELIKKIKKENITVSTVAVGSGSDIQLLQSIADGANGRFYYTDESTSIPQIFAKEAFMASRTYINNERFTPIISSSHNILANVAEKGLPDLLGYVGASPKDTAKVILKSNEDDPILTVWQYGLGKTVAWNSDVKGKWNADYVGWDKNISLWQNIINYTIENYEDSDSSLQIAINGNKGEVTLTAKDLNKDAEDLKASARIIAPSLEKIDVNLYATKPGEYSGTFDIKEKGVYLAKGIVEKGGEIVSAASNGAAVQYSPEYKINLTPVSIEGFAAEADGTFIKTPQEVFKGKLKEVSGKADLTLYLLTIALLLFALDIAFRRLNLPFEKLAAVFSLTKLKSSIAETKGEKSKKLSKKSEGINTLVNSRNKNKNSRKSKQDNLDKHNIDAAIKDTAKKPPLENKVKDKAADLKKETTKKEKEILDTESLLSRRKKK